MTKNKPLFIYLDQNKWIDLARAYHNRPDGKQFKSVLQKVTKAVESKRANFPLSAFHIAETQKRSDISSRKRLSKVMATISQGWAISLSEIISNTEIQLSGAKIFGCTQPNPPNVFGHGIAFAWGTNLRSLMENAINDPRATSDDFHLIEMAMSTPQMTEFLLAGMGNEESKLIDAKKEYEENISRIAVVEEQFRIQLQPHFQSEADHKRFYIANLQIVLRDKINSALSVYKKTLDEIISLGEHAFQDFIEDTPSLDVETQLVVRRNANLGKAVDKNDFADISALTAAIPYCDIVITENTWKDLAIRSGLDKKYNTVIVSDVNELNRYL
jgi:hypothetical protein